MLAVAFLRFMPAVLAVWEAIHVAGPGWPISLRNFHFLFTDPDFIQALRVTLLFSLVVNPLQITMALGLALLLSRSLPLVGVWRTLILLPVAIPQSVSAVIMGVVFRPDGPANAILAMLRLPPQPFLTSPLQALPVIILILCWIGVGYWMTFLIAGLKEIPRALYEAAEIDGASGWQRFLHITLPQLQRQLAFVLVADTIANFLIFAPVQILTQGGPEGSSNLIMNDIYTRGFLYGDPTGAAAETVVLVSVMLVIVSIQFRLMQGRHSV